MTVADKLRTKGATEKDASVFIGDTTYDLPMRKGTLGPNVVDISTLYQHTGRFTLRPRLHLYSKLQSSRSRSSTSTRGSCSIAVTRSNNSPSTSTSS